MTAQPPPYGYQPPQYGQQPYGQPTYGQSPQYGPPSQYSPPPQRPVFRQATGKQLLQASWGMLRQDRELLWLPVIATVTGFFAALIVFVPGFAIGWSVGGSEHHSWGGWVGGAFAAFAASVVSIYFQAALVIGAIQRSEGQDPTVRGVLAEAWTHRGRILSWAALTTTVGLAIRALEQRLGVLGSILGFLSGVAWAIASFFVVPVLVVEDLGPIDAVKRSAQLIRDTWGTSLRTTLRFGLTYLAVLLAPILVIVVGVVLFADGTTVSEAIGGLLIVAGVAGFLAVAMVFSAISTYARALIYRYATGRPVPGVDAQLFAGVFRPKRGRRGIA